VDFINSMTVSDYIAHYLERRGVTHVFELVGGMITVLLDSLHRRNRVGIVSMHHEQGAGFAAEGYGRMAGIPGVAMATSGPGATNLLTAIGSCYFDSVPAVFITGQVNRHELKGNRPIRQLGFQETDIVSVVHSLTKSALMVTDPADLPRLLDEAFDLAVSGRPGPVLLDIPMDVQRAEIGEVQASVKTLKYKHTNSDTEIFLSCLGNALAEAERPLVLAGGGVNSGSAREVFQQLVSKLGLPVVHSLMAVDVLPFESPARLGLIGSYGNRWANIALSESDLLLVLGSRLDVRQTGADTKSFKGIRRIFHVDCEPGELNNRVRGCEVLVTQLSPFLAKAAKDLPHIGIKTAWSHRLEELRRKWPDCSELTQINGLNPNLFMHRLAQASSCAAAYIVDVGQHQMWAAQSLELHSCQRFITSGGMGAMGFALPAAIGAHFASRQSIVVIAGDGGFQLNIQELQTVVRNRLPLKMIVINNNCHGMVRQFQDSYFQGRVQSTVWGYSAPSFEALAAAYGIRSRTLKGESELEESLSCLWEDPHRPFLLEVSVDPQANAYPKMAFGRPISEMEPLAKPIEMEGT
jgi:acetolactate synthase-1/2/3 large subunit